jgi:carbamoyl-phosphate synthase large subunit
VIPQRAIRRAAMQYSVPCITTLTGAKATAETIRALKEEKLEVRSLQDYHASAASK